MAESKLGTKHECSSCGAKFYDFGKPQAVCPKCGTDQAATSADEPPGQKKPSAQEAEPDLDDFDDEIDDDVLVAEEEDDEDEDDDDDDDDEGDDDDDLDDDETFDDDEEDFEEDDETFVDD